MTYLEWLQALRLVTASMRERGIEYHPGTEEICAMIAITMLGLGASASDASQAACARLNLGRMARA